MKKQMIKKPRYASTLRNSDLPTIRPNHSDYMKQYLIIDEKQQNTPRVARNYPPIIDIPFTKVASARISSTAKKGGFGNLAQIKKELIEYEDKLRKITGGGRRNVRVRSPIKQNLPKLPVKAKRHLKFSTEKSPIYPPGVDMSKAVVIIQKNWRGFRARRSCRQERRKIAHQRAREAIAELEMLKEQAKIDELYVDEDLWRPRTYSPLKHQKNSKLYKTHGKFFPALGYNDREEKSVVKIQSYFKMRIEQKRYEDIKQKARMIQRNIKRYQCMKLFQKILSAILFIQYQWKKFMYKNRKKVQATG